MRKHFINDDELPIKINEKDVLSKEELEQIKNITGSKKLSELPPEDASIVKRCKSQVRKDSMKAILANRDKIREEIKKIKKDTHIIESNLSGFLDNLMVYDFANLDLADLVYLRMKIEDATAKRIGYKRSTK
jgi:hypothetical protein